MRRHTPPDRSEPGEGGSVDGRPAQPDWERARGDAGATAEVDRDRDDLGETHDAGDDETDAMVLFTYPLLVDEGRLSEGADELKAALEDEAFLEVHPDDAARLGLADGDRAIVRTEAGEAQLPVRVSEHIAAGAAFVPFNQPGFAANTLLSGSTIATRDRGSRSRTTETERAAGVGVGGGA